MRASFNDRILPSVGFQRPFAGIYKHPNFRRAVAKTSCTWHDGTVYDEIGVVHRFLRVAPFPGVDAVQLAQVSWFSWDQHRTDFDAVIVHGLERRLRDQFVLVGELHNVSLTLNPTRQCDRRPDLVPNSASFVVLEFTSY